ncbi:hypothetical protein ABZT49_22060 [Methylobacterium sp. EM32]|uniref:hypothetical protein n=1 Tax=Methylobacterium sp. EM32 TaxID=3163481 RepID=UPI00339E0933
MAYFNHTIDGVTLDLAHLNPRRLTLFVQKLARELAIDVRFSNHCFTCKFEAGRHATTHLIMDHKQQRAYDAERHELSHRLPEMVDALPTASVYLTPTDRNYVYIANVTTTDGRQYPMYFSLRRGSPGHLSHLFLVVESAYPVAERRHVLAGTTKISFPVLCAKIYRGEPVRPRARR